jgi:hypothetical protein
MKLGFKDITDSEKHLVFPHLGIAVRDFELDLEEDQDSGRSREEQEYNYLEDVLKPSGGRADATREFIRACFPVQTGKRRLWTVCPPGIKGAQLDKLPFDQLPQEFRDDLLRVVDFVQSGDVHKLVKAFKNTPVTGVGMWRFWCSIHASHCNS